MSYMLARCVVERLILYYLSTEFGYGYIFSQQLFLSPTEADMSGKSELGVCLTRIDVCIGDFSDAGFGIYNIMDPARHKLPWYPVHSRRGSVETIARR